MARRGLSRDGGAFGIWWFWHAVMGILAVTVVALGALTVAHQQALTSAAAAEAAKYTPPPWPSTSASQGPIISVVGDSYTGGSDMNSGEATLWTTLLAQDLPVSVETFAVGGSGYVTSLPGASDPSTFPQRAAKVDPKSSEVIFFGSRNDGAADPAALAAAATDSYSAAQKAAPKAKLIVIGPPWVDSNPPAGIVSDRDVLKRVAAKFHAVWIDPLQGDWFPTGSGLIGADGVHPTDAGHAHLEKLIEPVVKANLPK